MIHTDEDDEFERIAHEAEMRKGQPYHFEEKSGWVNLTDKEILMAYGWKDFEAQTILQENYKTLILEGLRSVEAAIKEKNNARVK
jgi:hypothetical protein